MDSIGRQTVKAGQINHATVRIQARCRVQFTLLATKGQSPALPSSNHHDQGADIGKEVPFHMNFDGAAARFKLTNG